MKIKIWDGKTDRLVNTIEIPNEEIDHFIKLYGESFGKAIVNELKSDSYGAEALKEHWKR